LKYFVSLGLKSQDGNHWELVRQASSGGGGGGGGVDGGCILSGCECKKPRGKADRCIEFEKKKQVRREGGV
jgi:hypothetical protein